MKQFCIPYIFVTVTIAFGTKTVSHEGVTPLPSASTKVEGTEKTLELTTSISNQQQQANIASHKIPTQLEEKLASLSCDLPLLPSESRLWKGNETRELPLPIKVFNDCSITENSSCSTTGISWEGTIEIQSGDVLLVRIDDSKLIDQSVNETERSTHEPWTAVYQVTRAGHDHCDITEGLLLDITPLKVDNRKVVTLYDKDLTEGINLLIVVSELWNDKCIRLRVVVKSDNCGENEDCSGKGLCYSNASMEGYECQCCPGFVGPHCEEQDACYPSPCQNNGICVDISQGHEGSSFQCLCPYGYTGKTCQEETDPCLSMPCQNGATCTGNMSQFNCECPKGYSGLLCQHNLNECESSPCVHGICVDEEDGYKCYCQPGFSGQHCEYQYNECESSPCINRGICTDQVGTYSCTCTRGYTGKRCHIKVDLCEPNPCPPRRYCLDRGNNYTCECPTTQDCSVTPTRPVCITNPCFNGGTCWSSIDSFYCACRPGFTGKTCQDEFVVETVSNMEINEKDEFTELAMPMSIRLDHLHNIYIAAGTLACALFIVILILAACHCRVNKTYQRFTLPLKRHTPKLATPVNSEWFSGKDKAVTATPSRNLPSLETTDMYYTLDFSDSQSSPLIQ